MKRYWSIFPLVFVASGCSVTGDLFSGSLFSQRPAAVETQRTNSREVSFPLERRGSFYPEDKHPETLAQFALGLAEKGEATKAAAFFLEAADSEGAGSRWNRFRIASVAAAAALYLEAGEIERFQETASRLRREMDRYQIAAAEPEISLLLAISDKLSGKSPMLSPQIPWPVKELFREETHADRRQR